MLVQLGILSMPESGSNFIMSDQCLVVPACRVSLRHAQHLASVVDHNIASACRAWKLESFVLLRKVMGNLFTQNMCRIHRANATRKAGFLALTTLRILFTGRN